MKSYSTFFGPRAQGRPWTAFHGMKSIFPYFGVRFNYYLNRTGESATIRKAARRRGVVEFARIQLRLSRRSAMRPYYCLALLFLALLGSPAGAQARKEALIVFKDGFFLSGKVVEK